MDLTLSPGFNGLISVKFVFAEHHYVQLFNTDSLIRDRKMRELREYLLLGPNFDCGFK